MTDQKCDGDIQVQIIEDREKVQGKEERKYMMVVAVGSRPYEGSTPFRVSEQVCYYGVLKIKFVGVDFIIWDLIYLLLLITSKMH